MQTLAAIWLVEIILFYAWMQQHGCYVKNLKVNRVFWSSEVILTAFFGTQVHHHNITNLMRFCCCSDLYHHFLLHSSFILEKIIFWQMHFAEYVYLNRNIFIKRCFLSRKDWIICTREFNLRFFMDTTKYTSTVKC